MNNSIYFTNNLKIEVLLNNTVRLTNSRESEKTYLLDAKRLYQLLKVGGKQQRIPTSDGSFVQLSFNIERKHISSKGGMINTYIKPDDYKLLMQDLEILLKPELLYQYTGGLQHVLF